MALPESRTRYSHRIGIIPTVTLDPIFVIFLLILAVPILVSAASGLAFSRFVSGVGVRSAALVGAGMGIAVVGAGFGFVNGLDLLSRKVCRWWVESGIGDASTRNLMDCPSDRYFDYVMFGTYAMAFVLGVALTGLACWLRSRQKEAKQG